VDRSFFRFITIHAFDGQTDGQTDGRTDSFLIPIPRVHSMCGKKYTARPVVTIRMYRPFSLSFVTAEVARPFADLIHRSQTGVIRYITET